MPLCRFSEPVMSPPPACWEVICTFSCSIWPSRVFTRSTSALMRVSELRDMSLSELEMLAEPLKKSCMAETAWVRRRLEAGSSALWEKALITESSLLK